MLNTILLVVAGISFLLMLATIISKLPQLARVNVGQEKDKKIAQVKDALLEQRLKRRFSGVAVFFKNKFLSKFFNGLKNVYHKTMALEKKYKGDKSVKKMLRLESGAKEKELNNKIVDADELVKQENLEEAEKIYLEVAAVEPKNAKAFLGLAKIYLKRKDFEHARELYSYVLKLDKQTDRALKGLGNVAAGEGNWEEAKHKFEESLESNEHPGYYLELAEAEYNLGNPGKALTSIRRASEIEPNNPKYLDFLIDAAIINKNKILALDAFNKLKKINPDNNKLDEFKKRIQEM